MNSAAAPGWRLAAGAAPVIICLAVYWTGIRCWFAQDDFAWLGLGRQIHSFSDLVHTLFAPMAQGTIRPLSERLYFLSLFGLFGMDALPFRIVAFATQAANLVLLGAIAHRLTRSRIAAFTAPLLWGVNPGLGVPMSWSSSYNQLLNATFQLGAFLLFLRYVETGQRRFYYWQCAVFVLGFGALEINVVYPALAAAYALLAARRYLLSTAPLFAISGLYTLLHNYVAPKVQTGPYAMHLDGSMFHTLLAYWLAAFGWPALRGTHYGTIDWILTAAAILPWIFTAALLIFLISRLAHRDWLVLFPLFWFIIAIAPVLPLRDHYSEYYLTLPSIGIALAGAFAIAAYRERPVPLALTALVCATYLAGAIPAARNIVDFHHERSKSVRDLVWSVERIHEIHPRKVILLHGVNSGAYWAGINDNPSRLLGIDEIYLTPGSEEDIQSFPDLGNVDDFVLPAIVTRRLLDRNEAVVYSAATFPMRNITTFYHSVAKSRPMPEPSRRVDAGHRFFEEQIGDGWFPREGGYRWMGRRAVLWLGAPRSLPAKLYIQGYCPGDQLVLGPLGLQVTVDGKPLAPYRVTQANVRFDFVTPLPPPMPGADRFEVVLEVERTVRMRDENRDLGLAFGVFAIRSEP